MRQRRRRPRRRCNPVLRGPEQQDRPGPWNTVYSAGQCSKVREVVIAPSSMGPAWGAEAEDMPRKVEGSIRKAADTVGNQDIPDKELDTWVKGRIHRGGRRATHATGWEQGGTGMEHSVGKASRIPDAADSTWEDTVLDTVLEQARWLEGLTPERRPVSKAERQVVL